MTFEEKLAAAIERLPALRAAHRSAQRRSEAASRALDASRRDLAAALSALAIRDGRVRSTTAHGRRELEAQVDALLRVVAPTS